MPARTTLALAALAACPALAAAQAAFPAVFVANNGNLEGSVTSFRVEIDGSLTFVDRVVTGSRSSLSNPCPGCNPESIDLSPSGRFLATAHASGDGGEDVTVYEVAPDGSLTIVEQLTLSQAGLDIAWIKDSLLAAPLTDLSTTNQLRLYRFDEDNELTLVDSQDAGTFLTDTALHPNRRWLYTNDSFNNLVRVWEITGESASLIETVSIPVFGVALAVDPSGRFLYAAGGISAGGNAFAGLAIDQSDGTLTPLAPAPFTSPGASPKGFAFNPAGSVLYVSHGTDATIQTFTLDAAGLPTFSGNSFDVGLQGTLEGMATLPGLLFAIDETTAIDGIDGAYSFAADASGAVIPLPGTPVDTQGISPGDVVAWAGPTGCSPADLAEPSGVLDLADLQAFVAAFTGGDPAADLAPPAGVLDLADVQAFVAAFNAGCP